MLAFVLGTGKVSTSLIQRKFGVGYSRSAKLIDTLEEKGIIAPPDHTGSRKVIKKKE